MNLVVVNYLFVVVDKLVSLIRQYPEKTIGFVFLDLIKMGFGIAVQYN